MTPLGSPTSSGSTMEQETTGGGSVLQAPERRLTGIIAAAAFVWSCFQLSIASFLILDSLTVRAIHLGFALFIVFLLYPPLKRKRLERLGISAGGGIGPLDKVWAVVACFAAIYIVIDYAGITERQGVPLSRDIIVGALLTISLLEAARRAVGPALPIISILFVLYALYGHVLPDVLAFKGVSVTRLLGQMTMSTQGIYGIPLDVSANIVFLFVLFGAMLERAGAGMYFMRLALSVLGRFKGGPAKAAVLGSGLTGMVSGSSIANIVTTGTFTIPLMKKVGYPHTKAAAIEVAASTDGQLAPPVMGAAAFIIAEYVNVPYLEVVKAAAVPALVSYIALFYITHVEASKLGLRGLSPDETPSFRDAFVRGMHFLVPILVLIFELVYFRHSPQAAVFRAILVMTVIIMLEHPLRARREGKSLSEGIKNGLSVIGESLVAGARNMVPVAVATACAGIIVGVVTLGLGGLITEVIDTLSFGNLYLMLMITAFACILIGMGLPTTATYIVMASLTAPAMVSIGEMNGFVVPLIAAHLFCFYFGILADDTPPVGLASYAASAIAQSPPILTGLQAFSYHIRTAILPFMFIFNYELLLIGVDSVPRALLIVLSASIGAMAFVSATQGWFLCANRWYEIPCLLAVTVIMMRPGLPAAWLNLPAKEYSYFIGAGLYALVYLSQRLRAGPSAHAGSGRGEGRESPL